MQLSENTLLEPRSKIYYYLAVAMVFHRVSLAPVRYVLCTTTHRSVSHKCVNENSAQVYKVALFSECTHGIMKSTKVHTLGANQESV